MSNEEAFCDVIWQMPRQITAGYPRTLQDLLDAAPKGKTRTIDWYLEDPVNRIPEGWKGMAIFFRNSLFDGTEGAPCLRYLYWEDGRWVRYVLCLSYPIVFNNVFFVVPADASSCPAPQAP